MVRRVKSITIIGYILFLLYLTGGLFWGRVGLLAFQPHAAFLTLLYLMLMACALAVTSLKEWARQAMILINAVLCLYLSILALRYPEIVSIEFVLMSFIVGLYFIEKKVSLFFGTRLNFERKSILVVDDDPGSLKTVKGILLPNGYSVLTAATGEKGVQIAKQQKPDLIILDVILPGIKGRDVCAQLKEDVHSKDIPVIFLTAKDSPDDIKAEMEVGGVYHLTKPVNARALLSQVRKILG